MRINRYAQEGKSDNYQHAEARGLLKAGEAAALLTKRFGTKIAAAELTVFSKEWHHAGVFSGKGGSVKGRRVYFFSPEQLEQISLNAILANRLKTKPEPDNEIVQGWYIQFFKMTDPATYKRYSKPFVGIYKGPASKKPKGFRPLSDEAFEIALKQRGKALLPGEVPKF
ncbi:hypothetical protein MKQ68_07920 [Chitinophaga horti]|uniref:Uncharacterized protein n=1 Tax=Chitinophaga horti TaxID=2920382 RepID=A0ABY6JA22_9BACT|nr:hypothetical protein [Chitinophaga horti]UYQ95019.1 hypothetical protein MKQ68_07920 [Chitinophaga horti]